MFSHWGKSSTCTRSSWDKRIQYQWEEQKDCKIGELSELAVLSINCTSNAGKETFSLIAIIKIDGLPEGNCILALEQLVLMMFKYYYKAPYKFSNKWLKDVIKDPKDWIIELESLEVQNEKIDLVSKIFHYNCMFYFLGSLP